MLGGLGHVYGWPIVRGGSQRLADALVAELESLGGQVVCDRPVRSLDELPPHRVVIADVTPRQLLELAGDRVDAAGRRRLRRFRYGPGVCKVDYALSEPVPWARPTPAAGRARSTSAARSSRSPPPRPTSAGAATPSGRSCWRPSRACSTTPGHPRASTRCGPTRTCPTAPRSTCPSASPPRSSASPPASATPSSTRHVTTADAYERYNPTFVGGDISGGWHGGTQLVFRPWPTLHPYRTPVDGVFLCSASTPPGGGVHGMCGANAAADALSWLDR